MLADDHTLFRQGIRTLISAEADMEVVAEAAKSKPSASPAAVKTMAPSMTSTGTVRPRPGAGAHQKSEDEGALEERRGTQGHLL